jgi:alanine racemase
MYHFTVNDIISGTGATLIGKPISEIGNSEITELAYDSRKIIHADKTLFMALVTSNGNGHRYIQSAYEKGVRYFLVSEIPDRHQYNDCIFLQTHDTLSALQQFATRHRQAFKGKILALTGSNGKTTIKEWLHFLLSPEIKLTASPGSYNSVLGIPLSILMLSQNDTLGIIETGISEPGEMKNAQDWVKPDYGILTNIGTSHLENFIDKTQLLNEKLSLFKKADYFIYRSDNELIKTAVKNLFPDVQGIPWHTSEDIHGYQIAVKEKNSDGCDIAITSKDKQTIFHIPFSDDASIENACHCAVFCLQQNLMNTDVIERFAQLRQVDMRLQMVGGLNNCTLLNDSYTSDIPSLRIALEALALLPGLKERSVILTDMRLRGKPALTVYTESANLLKSYQPQKIILIGKEISHHKDLFSGQVFHYDSTEDFITLFPTSSFQSEAILIKGTREFKTERIVEMLEQKRHETVLEVNLDALAHNVAYYRKTAGPNVKVMAMVKAFSYGTGSIEIANHLKYRNVDYLAVAYTDEGAELRRAGIDLPIMVMNPGQPAVNMLLEHRLEPEIFNFRSLHYLMEELSRRSESYVLPVHIKIDTGMHRLGFSPEDALLAAKKIKAYPHMRIASVFSHLASAEDADDDKFTSQQISVFKKTCDAISDITQYPFIRHIANSAGAARHADSRFDMVRMGIAMYGISPYYTTELQSVLRLKTSVTQVREIKAGESVGYNRAGKVERDSLIATIPMGYADGFRRSLGLGNGQVHINGNLYPVIGKVCMDMTMIDITGSNIQEGDEVIIFGPEYSVEEMAKKCGTISYEILTGISPRVKRVYLKE